MSPPFGGRRYSPVKDMSKDQMDKAVAELRAICNSPEDEIREAIHATDGDLDAAGMRLYGEPIEQHASASEEAAARRSVAVDQKAADEEFLGTITEEAQRSDVRKLLEIFPNRKPSQIQQALRRRNYEFTEAAEDLADLSPSSSPEPPCSRPRLKVRFTNRAGSHGAPPSSSSPSSSSGVPRLSNHESPSSESDSPIFTPRTTASVSPKTGSAVLPLRYADWGFGELGRPKTPEKKRADDEMAHDGDSSTPKTKREGRAPAVSRPSKWDHYIILDSDDADDVDMDSLLDRPVKKESSPATSHESGREIDVDALLAGVTAADGHNAMMIESDQNPSNNLFSKEPAPEGEGLLGSISWDDKVEHLMTVCPAAGRSMCAVELQLADGNVEEAFRELEGEFGVGGAMREESADEDDESEEGDDEDEVESSVARGKRPASLKRRARPSKHSRPQKRRHRAEEEAAAAAALEESRKIKSTEEEEGDDDDEAEGLEPASQWVQSTIHADDGVTIILDTGSHACKIPRKILRKLPELKGIESIDDGSLKVPHVSQHTFDLALQWAVCKNGRLEKAQRKDKAAEVGAYVDLAVFASRVGLGLGSSQSPLLARLRAVLTSDRDALLGTHIRQAYTRLGEGHRVRQLLLQASVKAYAQFKHQDPADDDDDDDDGDDSEDVSAEEALALNPAQRASYLKERFRFGAEMRSIKAYRYDLMEEFQRVWWRRTSHQVRYRRTAHWCTRTELTDPLSDEQFFIS
ncbi:uncharacterized protein L3040_008979 [Drepanopeziza brunnea f. sp. 'multigermtubi']|uniref:CUE domain-containing protein n=1 Tax=Marssonina brunnea f. sp. multigermtubi (strain MB_m1) TaxID=1072389 RepID=K1WWA6_MARBU|nr:uncharacterized protein MBM_04908 [Drepanopeziza brunnea f. sp. 'multigermtubi' MB_m1]EKD17331.1 hypothetical protein MBM_04908 [Drepanopeziza brunnea f. sp. 'multigermtubi' MB_m1]KAJ5032374.1 hypothetical protein L3040_008979 [Drepanopeziza brunnea f. sp. 'multigermtubi']